MALYRGNMKVCPIVPKWRGFWSVIIYGFKGTVVDCGSQKTIGNTGFVVFKFAEAGTYTFIAAHGEKTGVKEIILEDGNYFIEESMYIGFVVLDYIESTGTQWIDLGVKCNNNTRIEATWSTAAGSIPQYLYGTSLTDPRVSLYIDARGGGSTNQRFGTSYVTVNSHLFVDGVKHTTIHDKNGFKFDTNLYSYSNVQTFTTPQNLYILQNIGDPGCFFIGKLYSMKIYENETLKKNLVPVLYNGKVCIYDSIGEQFFYNAGTGEFIAGPIKE